jgi:uncharacterized membrane protein YedE/YeeE
LWLLRLLLMLRLLELGLLMLLRLRLLLMLLWLRLLLMLLWLRLLVLRRLALGLLPFLHWLVPALLMPIAIMIVFVGQRLAGAEPKQEAKAGQPHCSRILVRSMVHDRGACPKRPGRHNANSTPAGLRTIAWSCASQVTFCKGLAFATW